MTNVSASFFAMHYVYRMWPEQNVTEHKTKNNKKAVLS